MMYLQNKINGFAMFKGQEVKEVKFFKSRANILFSILTLILTASLICSLTVIKKKNTYIAGVKAEISENQSRIEEANGKIMDFEAQLSEKEKASSEVQSQLEAAQREKKKLEDENAELKKKIEQLKAQKASEAVTPAVSVQTSVPETRRVCYLTFDDGPSANTLKVLEILNRYGVKATFFVINSADIQYVKNISEAGHTVGLHTATHNYKKIYASEGAYFADLQQISDIVYGITGIRSTVMRFPGGSSNGVSAKYCKGLMTRLVKAVHEKGYSFFDWNVSSGDAASVTPSYTSVRNNVLTQAKNKNSVCVLMHDAAAKTTTVQALPEIIEGLTAMGYTFETLKPESYGYHHTTLHN